MIKKNIYMSKVNVNSTVTVHYTGKFEDGNVFDTSLIEGREPLKATLGQGQLIPGFENGLIDMEVGDKKTVMVESSQAYGQVIPELIQEVALTQLPENVQAGNFLQTMTPNGPQVLKVLEVKEETALLDANHPLAGKNLVFELELLEVE